MSIGFMDALHGGKRSVQIDLGAPVGRHEVEVEIPAGVANGQQMLLENAVRTKQMRVNLVVQVRVFSAFLLLDFLANFMRVGVRGDAAAAKAACARCAVSGAAAPAVQTQGVGHSCAAAGAAVRGAAGVPEDGGDGVGRTYGDGAARDAGRGAASGRRGGSTADRGAGAGAAHRGGAGVVAAPPERRAAEIDRAAAGERPVTCVDSGLLF